MAILIMYHTETDQMDRYQGQTDSIPAAQASDQRSVKLDE